MMKKEKKAHGVQVLLRAVVRDPDGKIITDTGRKPTRSFVIQFLEFLGALFDGVDADATTTAGTEVYICRAIGTCNTTLRLSAGVNVSTYGIMVGTGIAAEDNTDYKLDTQLTEGVGAGNITHGETVIETPGVVGANVDLEIYRSFTNSTGSTITVKEAGLAAYHWYGVGPKHLLIRDVLPASIDVPDKCSLTIFYTLRTTV